MMALKREKKKNRQFDQSSLKSRNLLAYMCL